MRVSAWLYSLLECEPCYVMTVLMQASASKCSVQLEKLKTQEATRCSKTAVLKKNLKDFSYLKNRIVPYTIHAILALACKKYIEKGFHVPGAKEAWPGGSKWEGTHSEYSHYGISKSSSQSLRKGPQGISKTVPTGLAGSLYPAHRS